MRENEHANLTLRLWRSPGRNPHAWSPDADAELIALCAKVSDIDAELADLSKRWSTRDLKIEEVIAQEEALEPEVDALFARRGVLGEQLRDLEPPTSQAGAAAVARVGLSGWQSVGPGGAPIAPSFEDWVHLGVLKFLVEIRDDQAAPAVAGYQAPHRARGRIHR